MINAGEWSTNDANGWDDLKITPGVKGDPYNSARDDTHYLLYI